MSSRTQKVQILVALAALLSLATAVSCKGFFVNSPDSLTISPNSVTFSDVPTDPEQLLAQATFGSKTQDVTTSTVWKTSNVCTVSVSTTNLGQINAVGTGSSATITATYNGVSATITASVPTGIAVTPCGTFNSGTNQAFTATLSGSDVTSASTWTSSNNNIVNFASPSSSTATFGPTTGTATINVSNGGSQGKLIVTVK